MRHLTAAKQSSLCPITCLPLVVIVVLTTLALAFPARAAIVTNGDFEADANIPDNTLRVFNPVIDGWTAAGLHPFLYDPPATRMSSQGGENNTAYVDRESSVQQTLGITLANNTLYTLTVDVGNNDAAGGTIYFFPTLGDGVATGNVFARLLANGGASPMPGFVSSSAVVPPAGFFTTWTLLWQTGPSEPLAGTAIVIDLSVGSGNTEHDIEAFFDNVSLTTAVPEPTSMALLGAGGLLALRRVRKSGPGRCHHTGDPASTR